MEKLCPYCMGAMADISEKKARCSLCGREYDVLFSREEPNPAPQVEVRELDKMCIMHPGVPAVKLCSSCGAPVCETCVFTFPGEIYLCPICATAPKKDLTGKRKTYLVWSIVMASWVTLYTFFILCGGVFGLLGNGTDELINMAIGVFWLIPNIIGTALGFAAYDRRLSNPPVVYISIVWNLLFLALIFIFTILGAISKWQGV